LTSSTEWRNASSPTAPSRTIIKVYDVKPSGSETYRPREKEFNNLIFGVIFLVFIIICSMLKFMISTQYAQDYLRGCTTANRITSSAPLTVSPNSVTLNTGRMINPIPTIVPPGNSAAVPPDASLVLTDIYRSTVSEIISPYVTIEPKASLDMGVCVSLQPSITQKYREGYVAIYSLTNQNVSQVLPLVSFTRHNPPLVIDYNITPLNQVRIKHVEYKMLETYFEENLEINHPYEDSWFRIIVRKKDTGEVISEDGIGRNYSFQTPKLLVVREYGNYSFEFKGSYRVLNLTMNVKQKGNFP
jgi:hypothetical protein